MPAYNRAPVLGTSISQVLAQTFTDFEFIVYDDGSTDNTLAVISEFADTRIKLVSKPNLGPPHPLNAILQLAVGEYIIIVHDHDFFHPTMLEKSVRALDENPDVGFVLQGSAWVGEDGVSSYREMLLDLPLINNGLAIAKDLLLQPKSFNSFFHACSMVRKSTLVQAGYYYEVRFGLYADTDLWLRLLAISNFAYLPEVLFTFRTRETQGHFLSNREFEILKWLADIHRTNAERIFVNEKAVSCKNLIERKWARLNQRAVLMYAAAGNLGQTTNGLAICRTQVDGNKMLGLLFWAVSMHRSTIVLFVSVCHLMARMLKRVR
jgi:glycosyltransferase involved in cell wall biosynthesis